MKFITALQVFGAQIAENGAARVATAPFKVISSDGLNNIPIFSHCGTGCLGDIGKLDYSRMIPPADKRVMAWIDANANHHAPFVNEATSLKTQYGKHHGKTCLLVLCGPSAAGIAERIAPYRDHPDFKVATLNLSSKAVPDCDYFCNFEQLIPRDYFEHLDPERTTLLTCPMAGNPPPHQGYLASKWGGRNVYYSYMGDMRQPTDPRWDSLPLLFSALHTGVAALQAIYHMGFSNVLLVGADYSMANPSMDPRNPCAVLEADWYFDGTKYQADGGNMGKSYYNGQPLALAKGIDGKTVALLPMLHKHMLCTAAAMEVMHEAGVNVRNCSGQGILDYNTHNLEDSLAELLKPQLQEVA